LYSYGSTDLLFESYLEFNAIKARQIFSEEAKPIKHIICCPSHGLDLSVTAFICACEGREFKY
jgi:hypothetical protein